MSAVKSIIKKYGNHSFIISINNKVGKPENNYDIHLGAADLSANIIDPHLANMINYDLDNNSLSEDAKIATVRPIYRKSYRDKIEKYRSASI